MVWAIGDRVYCDGFRGRVAAVAGCRWVWVAVDNGGWARVDLWRERGRLAGWF